MGIVFFSFFFPQKMDTSQYPLPSSQPDGPEIAAKLVSLFSFSLLSTLFGIKTYNVHFRYLTYSRWLILALYVFSWSFTASSMLLVTTNNSKFMHSTRLVQELIITAIRKLYFLLFIHYGL
jgi:hypothetical protein